MNYVPFYVPFYKTLKGEAIRPPRTPLATQQRAFNRFRRAYNDERPHQFLQGRTPASLSRSSPREYTGALPPIDYPGHFIVKRITNAGTFRFKRRLLLIANALKQHAIGLEEVADGIWSIHFCHVLLGRIDERDYIIRACPNRPPTVTHVPGLLCHPCSRLLQCQDAP